MGFFDKVVSAGSSFVEKAERNYEKQCQNIARDISRESNYAKGKTNSELIEQFKDKDKSYASRYAAKTELEKRKNR